MKCFVLDGTEVKIPQVNEELGVPHIEIVHGAPQFGDRCCVVGGEVPDIGEAGIVVFSDSIPESVKRLNPQQVVLVGVRDLTTEDVQWIGRGAKYYTLNTIMQEGIVDMAFVIMEAARQFQKVYVYADTSVVESVGGMTSRELLFLLHKLKILNTFTVLHCNGNRELVGKMIAEFY